MVAMPLETFQQLMRYDTQRRYCLEILFRLDDDPVYHTCWMGKMPSVDDPIGECYWYGLTEDGTQGYDFATLAGFLQAKVFAGKSLVEVWDRVRFHSINGLDVDYGLRAYLPDQDNTSV